MDQTSSYSGANPTYQPKPQSSKAAVSGGSEFHNQNWKLLFDPQLQKNVRHRIYRWSGRTHDPKVGFVTITLQSGIASTVSNLYNYYFTVVG